MSMRTRLVYGLLIAVWGLIVAWQAVEHNRIKNSAQEALRNRSRDITTTLSLVIRSQRRFGVVSQERLASALKELVKSGELNAIALLNASGDVVISAGGPIDFETKGMRLNGEHWDARHMTSVHEVDLGASETPEGENTPRTIVLPPRPPGQPRERPRPPEGGPTNFPGPGFTRFANGAATNTAIGLATNDAPADATNTLGTGSSATNKAERTDAQNQGERRRRPPRPPWMSEAEYKSLLETRGLDRLAIAMSTDSFRRACGQDLWLRCIIGCFAAVSVAGLGLSWRNLTKSSELQMRLLRASELNSHLKEMNLAAAGLAHETRNPLNLIRGLAQMVSKEPDAAPEIRDKLRAIVDETDRVTAQLNEFINYSKPREVRRSAVALSSVIGEVVRALSCDIEEKGIRLQVLGDELSVEADEQLLRQSLFNLLLNAIQAVDPNGEIQITASKRDGSEASLDVLDNGPGVPVSQRHEIFKPYVTTHEKGTGLGLAVVQQIVLAHGWEVECLPNEPKGAIFRITHLKVTARN
jgi:signal transduction histidine kinase